MSNPTNIWMVLSDDRMDYYRGTVLQARMVMERADDYSISAMPSDFMLPEELDQLPLLSTLLKSQGVKP